jgi:2-polyprenyl-3-methyl-5-hydroxy-6-metoxy-1,4-benzoquinol methylase
MIDDKQSQPVTVSDKSALFERSYLDWKEWHGESFGALTSERRKYFSAELKRLKKPLMPGSRVLEIGFGNGFFLAYASELGMIISGTELNADLVREGVKRGLDVHHTNSVSCFPKESFDFVVAFDVLEHIPQEELCGFMKEVHAVLRPGGVFLARFPNGDSPFGLINQNGDMTHVTSLGSSKVRHLAAASAMQVLFIGGEVEPLLGTSGLFILHRIISWPFKYILNIFINFVILGRRNIAFCSLNLIAILKKA